MSARKDRPTTSHYDERFYAGKDLGSYRSATVILPLVFSIIAPRSVVDVGCGTGTWLRVVEELGVHDYFGYDGAHVPQLRIARERFAAADLSQPLHAARRFDLAISCEVAEHLPSSAATSFVATLCSLSDVVLFSAAIPGQGGVHHINEQWPEYWRARFREKGYSAYDCIRLRVWGDDRVEWWYRQNAILYVADSAASRFHLPEKSPQLAALVHPVLYESLRDKKFLRNAVRKTRRALARFTGRNPRT